MLFFMASAMGGLKAPVTTPFWIFFSILVLAFARASSEISTKTNSTLCFENTFEKCRQISGPI